MNDPGAQPVAPAVALTRTAAAVGVRGAGGVQDAAPVIRVIVHEATRSGSLKTLLRLLDWANEHAAVRFSIDARSGGVLSDDLRARVTAPPGAIAQAVLINSTVALVNSSVALGVGGVGSGQVPVVCYVHEDSDALDGLDEASRRLLVHRCNQVWCVSDDVAQQVVALGVAPERVTVIPPVIGHDIHIAPEVGTAVKADALRQSGTHLIVGCGPADWHKGPDLFVDVARRIRDAHSGARFVWVGPRPRHWARVLSYDVEHLQLGDSLTWVGEVDDPSAYFTAADVVISTSRREAWPLVPLEAGLCGTPTCAFAVGGFVSMARQGLVVAVQYPDTAALADSVRGLLTNAQHRKKLVDEVRRHVVQNQSIEVVGPAFGEAIQRLLRA